VNDRPRHRATNNSMTAHGSPRRSTTRLTSRRPDPPDVSQPIGNSGCVDAAATLATATLFRRRC
jgi:hypothetical protein